MLVSTFIIATVSVVTGLTGVGFTGKAWFDMNEASDICEAANKRVEMAALRLDDLRKQCEDALEAVGSEKVYVLSNTMKDFVDTFQRIKNVDFKETVGLMELKDIEIDKKQFEEISAMTDFALAMGGGIATGAVGGAIVAFGAYSAATHLAVASTGAAISGLSGAAATNATLAWFGGGAIANGGLGIAGGTAVLGGLVAGPALLVMGIITGAKAGTQLEKAKADAAEAKVICEQMEAGADQCVAIRRRCYMLHSILARLDSRFMPVVDSLMKVVEEEGEDYQQYSDSAKKIVAGAASLAVTIKTVLDTPILDEEGELTEESREVAEKMSNSL